MSKRKTVHGSGVFTGAWLSKDERDWLNLRAAADGLTVSQVLRKTIQRANAAGWAFGGPVDLAAARKGGAV
jgi:hypothetical protein